jgi:hypothetical protein
MTAWAFAQLPAADADDADTRASPGAAVVTALAAAVTCCVERRAEGDIVGMLSPMSLTNLMWAHANLRLPLRPHALRLLVEEVRVPRGLMHACWIYIYMRRRVRTSGHGHTRRRGA